MSRRVCARVNSQRNLRNARKIWRKHARSSSIKLKLNLLTNEVTRMDTLRLHNKIELANGRTINRNKAGLPGLHSKCIDKPSTATNCSPHLRSVSNGNKNCVFFLRVTLSATKTPTPHSIPYRVPTTVAFQTKQF